MKEYTLRSPFDIEQHKKAFPNYLEVLITPDGTVINAVPSHQEMAITLACKKLGKTKAQIYAMCPDEMKLDFLNWLLSLTGSIAVWRQAYCGPEITNKQAAKLKLLKMHGMYRGNIKRKTIPWPDLIP